VKAILAAAVLIAALAACGVKAPPRPPVSRAAAPSTVAPPRPGPPPQAPPGREGSDPK
jgi:predicted small lipoprotein YifL